MKTNWRLFLAGWLLLTLPLCSMAQKQQFTLEDLNYGGNNYYNMIPENRYTTWWGDELVRTELSYCTVIDKKTGEEKTLFGIEELNRWASTDDSTRIRHFYYAQFPYPGEPLVMLSSLKERILVNWEQKAVVWRQNRRNEGHEESAEDWCAASRAVAFVSDHNLYVTDGDGRLHTLSTDGSRELVYGQSVHRDEFGIEKGTFWSPDGQRLAFYRMDQSMVTDYPQVNIDTRIATYEPDKYPMAGETSHKVTVGVYDLKSGKTVYLDAGDPTDRYFTNIAWSPDSKTVYLIELDRSQKHAKLDAYNAETGQFTATLFREDNSKYFEPRTPIQFLPWDSKRFIYATRRDGYNHIYLYKLDGNSATLERQLTKGQFEVFNVLGFNQKEKTVVFTSNESDPIGCALYAVDMKGKRTALGDTGGWHSAVLSDAGTTAMDSWAMPEGPIAHRQDLVDTSTGKRLTFMDSQDPWDNFNVPEIKTGTLKAADGVTDLYYRLILPTNFNPEEKYPAVVYVYGGPHAHNIDASRHWGARGWDIWMAQNGYVMFCLDNRGSEHRGLDFEQATFKHLGVEEMKDQLKGIDYLKSLPYVDGDRIGVHGWSFGGFMTTSLMTTYPDVFKVGVAGGPVIDWKYYEVMYGERYMETPQSNPEGYAASSCLNKADKLKGRLLIIYGGNDPVCVPQHTLSFIRACIDADTYPDLFTYPGDEHNMMGSDRVHLHKKITQYFEDFLK